MEKPEEIKLSREFLETRRKWLILITLAGDLFKSIKNEYIKDVILAKEREHYCARELVVKNYMNNPKKQNKELKKIDDYYRKLKLSHRTSVKLAIEVMEQLPEKCFGKSMPSDVQAAVALLEDYVKKNIQI